jgi:hypothetical protein
MKLNHRTKANPAALSGLLVSSVFLWFVSVAAFRFANLQSKDGWSKASLPTLLVLVAVPLLLPIFVPWLVRARRTAEQRFTGFDRFAVGLAAAPYLFVTGLITYWLTQR